MTPVESPSGLDKSSSGHTTDSKPEQSNSFDGKPEDAQSDPPQHADPEDEDPTAKEAYQKETIIDTGRRPYINISTFSLTNNRL